MGPVEVMGNTNPSQNGRSRRSFSDDMSNQERRHHAKSDEIPYNFQSKQTGNNGKPYFSSKPHYNHNKGYHNGYNNGLKILPSNTKNNNVKKSPNHLSLDIHNNSAPESAKPKSKST